MVSQDPNDPNFGLETDTSNPNFGLPVEPPKEEGGVLSGIAAGIGRALNPIQLIKGALDIGGESDISKIRRYSTALGEIVSGTPQRQALEENIPEVAQQQKAVFGEYGGREQAAALTGIGLQAGLVALPFVHGRLSEIAFGKPPPVTETPVTDTIAPVAPEVPQVSETPITDSVQPIAPEEVIPNASEITGPEGLPVQPLREEMGGETPLRQPGETPETPQEIQPETVPQTGQVEAAAAPQEAVAPETPPIPEAPTEVQVPVPETPVEQQPPAAAALTVKPIDHMSQEEYGAAINTPNYWDSLYRYGEPKTDHPFFATDIMSSDILGTEGEHTAVHGVKFNNPLVADSRYDASEKLLGKNIYSGKKVQSGVSPEAKAVLEADNKLGNAAEKAGYDAIVTPREVQVIDKSKLPPTEKVGFNEKEGYYTDPNGNPIYEGIGYDRAKERASIAPPEAPPSEAPKAEVQPPPVPPETPPAIEGSVPTTPEVQKQTGISNQRLTEAYGDNAPVATTGKGPGAWKDEGLSRLDNFQKTGDVKDDPYTVLTNLREGKVPVADMASDVSLLRSEHQRLLEDARNSEGTPDYQAKSQAALDMATAIKGVAHGPASDVFRALQEYDVPRYDNVTDFDQALRERLGRESTSQERAGFKQIADDVTSTRNGAEEAINGAQKKLGKYPRMNFDDAAKSLHDQIAELTKNCVI